MLSVRTTFVALHQFAGAPEAVGYLRLPHRHEFVVDIHVDINPCELNRSLEFHLLEAQLKKVANVVRLSTLLPVELTDQGHIIFFASCEMFAEIIAKEMLSAPYLKDVPEITVRVGEEYTGPAASVNVVRS